MESGVDAVPTTEASTSGKIAPGRSTAELILWSLFFKVAYTGIVFVTNAITPAQFNGDLFVANSHGMPKPDSLAMAHFMTWDTMQYLYLSMHPYRPGITSDAFYPLWPLCIRLFTPIAGGSHLIAGLVLSNAFAVVAMVLLYRLAEGLDWITDADSAVALFLAAPGAMFLFFPYTESLFLLLSCVTFLSLKKDNLGVVAICTFLLALTRPTGVFWTVVIAGYFLWTKQYKRIAMAIFPLLGYGAYLLLMYVSTGNAFEYQAEVKHFAGGWTSKNIVDIVSTVQAFGKMSFDDMYFQSPIDRVLFVLCIATLPKLYRCDKLLFLYTLAIGVFPVPATHFTGYSRYVLMAFPAFFVLSQWLSGVRRRPALACVAVLFGSVQLLFLIRMMNYYWVG